MFVQFKCVWVVLKGEAPTEGWFHQTMPYQISHDWQWIDPHLACYKGRILYAHNFINTIWLQNTMLNLKYTVNQKIQYNHCNTNYILELFMAYSVVDGEFLLE